MELNEPKPTRDDGTYSKYLVVHEGGEPEAALNLLEAAAKRFSSLAQRPLEQRLHEKKGGGGGETKHKTQENKAGNIYDTKIALPSVTEKRGG